MVNSLESLASTVKDGVVTVNARTQGPLFSCIDRDVCCVHQVISAKLQESPSSGNLSESRERVHAVNDKSITLIDQIEMAGEQGRMVKIKSEQENKRDKPFF